MEDGHGEDQGGALRLEDLSDLPNLTPGAGEIESVKPKRHEGGRQTGM